MDDVQNYQDGRQVDIDQVGVTDLSYPIVVLDRENGQQKTVALISMSVNLPHHFKGTHMSRFLEVLNRHRGEITMKTIPTILADIRKHLHAQSATLEVCFPYFVERSAPVSGARGLIDYECTFFGEANGQHNDFALGVRVPVASLCPCSKTISDYGAHNQRGYLSIEIRTYPTTTKEPTLIWIEELIQVAEEAASSPLYPVLKRSDERHVTMRAYGESRFVEDMVRDVAVSLKNDPRVSWFRVHVVNHESIHNHNVFARVEWPNNNSNKFIGEATNEYKVVVAG